MKSDGVTGIIRAQPEPDQSLDLRLPPAGVPNTGRFAQTSFLLRLPAWIKANMAEAAEREDLSINIWAIRVLSEHAKLSRDGWRSIPSDDPARPTGFTKPSPAPIVVESTPPPRTHIERIAEAFPVADPVLTTTFTPKPSEPSIRVPWTPPPSDIPDLS